MTAVRLLLMICCILGLTIPPVYGAQQPASTEILKQARQSYYSLKNEHMTEVQCNMTPNWKMVLAGQEITNPAQFDAVMQLLNQLRFSVKLGLDGNAKVTHNEIPVDNEQVKQGLEQIYGGMEQMTTGFFQTWSVYMMDPALPMPGSDFTLEDLGSEYRISYKDGNADVLTMLGKNSVIRTQKITTAGFVSTLNPQFTTTAKGLILSGYQGDYRSAVGSDTTEVQVEIDYQDVDGLQLPKKLNLKGSYGGSPFQVEVAFSACHTTK